MKVMLDPGHGGSNKGAYCAPLMERELNVLLALVIGKHLKPEHECNFTRMDDVSLKNSHRAYMANDWEADILISVHHNAWRTADANGFEVLYHPNGKESFVLAKSLCDTVCGKWPDIRNRGPKARRDLIVLRASLMPAILIEAGFISSVQDRNHSLLNPVQRDMFYSVIATSIVDVLNRP